MERLSTKRPPQNERCFVSEAVEAKIEEVVAFIDDQELAWLFSNCYPNTLDTTVSYQEKMEKLKAM